MLDDDEFRRVCSLFNTGTEGSSKKTMYSPALREYEPITGFRETNPNVLWDHVLSKCGPRCEKCGKPLGTRRAKLCGSCMHPRTA